MKNLPTVTRAGGFALIITLTLMVLLTLLVVGLLSLSTISLRTSSQGAALATARANARLALILALGELQKSAGPDRRITARADILADKVANPQITGVWESQEIKATPPPSAANYKMAAKDAKFQAWLVSHPDVLATRQAGFARREVASPVTLWGRGTVGDKALIRGRVSATKVPIAPVLAKSLSGGLAWAVLDEGLKVRVNTPYIDAAASVGAKTQQLGAGERPGVEFIDGLVGLDRNLFEKDTPTFAKIEKGISRANYGLVAQALGGATQESLQTVTHDITTQSVGLFTDVVHGGFKQDFQLLMNASTLPLAYQGKGVYASRLGLNAAAVPADPMWGTLQQFYRLYRDKLLKDPAGVPYLRTQVPSGWVASSGTPPDVVVNRKSPPGLVLLPTLAKVQMLFSLIGHDIYEYPPPIGNPVPIDAPAIHEPQAGSFRGTIYNYDLHLLYQPIVTLHNPYNVAIECSDLRVELINVPFGMQVFRNGIAQSIGIVPLETMTKDNEFGDSGKLFGMNLKDKTYDGKPGSTTFRMLPGEVKVFSPYIDPNFTWRDALLGGTGTNQFWDIQLQKQWTANMDAIPGWRGDSIGYSCDWLAGDQPSSTDSNLGHQRCCYGLARDDQIHVIFAPLSIPISNNKFTIQMSMPDGDTRKTISVIDIDYQSATGLQDALLGPGKTLRYPKSGTVRGLDMVDHATTPLKNYIHTKPFALLSVQANTTSGGRDPSNEDGRYATKPWCFAHANAVVSSQKFPTEGPANQSHQIEFQLLEKGTANLVQTDKYDRGNFMSGQTAFNGTKFGCLYDVPLAAPQNFSTLNGANPGGASGYLPRFAQPIGNSWAHPLMSPSNLMEAKGSSNYLDHSFLLNLVFFDSFYFSGLAAESGPFVNIKATPALAAEFADGKPLADPRLLLHLPDSRPASEFAAEVAKPDALSRVAAWQLMEGAFNINSTSVLAWKAMLASIHDSHALVNQLVSGQGALPPTTSLIDLPPPGTGEARISRLRLPAATSMANGASPKDGYWLGPREYSDAQLQKLAENIVKQVRLRGPFLSMAEFVNRRLGTDQAAQRGALQQAIDDANVNPGLAVASNAGFEIPVAQVGTYKYANAPAGAGSSYQGAPGFLTQADLINVLGNAATPRSDTFTIRGYGEACDAAGKVLACATCEAVVQRFPEWCDPADPVETAFENLKSDANKTYGRRFLITSLRWLSATEI